MKIQSDNRHIEPELVIVNQRPKVVAPPPQHKPTKSSIHFILLKVQPGTKKKTLNELKKIPGISGCHPVYGEFDLVLLVREKPEVDKRTLIKRIWTLTNVVEVQTLVAAS
jgi:DNA-binding Lrp family transcriptional regulator